jgi:hypothetical protein
MDHCAEIASVAYLVEVVDAPVQVTEPARHGGLFLCPAHDPARRTEEA